MSESTLFVVFVSFATLLLLGVIIWRKLSVKDIFDDISSPFKGGLSPAQKNSPFSAKSTNSPFSAKSTKSLGEKPGFKLDRKTINIIGKIMGAVGAIMLFAPLPASYNNFSLGIAFLGYLIAKATAPPKKKTGPASQDPTAQKIRQLATRPEYQEAIKLLFSDLKNPSLATNEEKYQRSIKYLQTKGISPAEAKENLQLLTTLLNRQRK